MKNKSMERLRKQYVTLMIADQNKQAEVVLHSIFKLGMELERRKYESTVSKQHLSARRSLTLSGKPACSKNKVWVD